MWHRVIDYNTTFSVFKNLKISASSKGQSQVKMNRRSILLKRAYVISEAYFTRVNVKLSKLESSQIQIEYILSKLPFIN